MSAKTESPSRISSWLPNPLARHLAGIVLVKVLILAAFLGAVSMFIAHVKPPDSETTRRALMGDAPAAPVSMEVTN